MLLVKQHDQSNVKRNFNIILTYAMVIPSHVKLHFVQIFSMRNYTVNRKPMRHTTDL